MSSSVAAAATNVFAPELKSSLSESSQNILTILEKLHEGKSLIGNTFVAAYDEPTKTFAYQTLGKDGKLINVTALRFKENDRTLCAFGQLSPLSNFYCHEGMSKELEIAFGVFKYLLFKQNMAVVLESGWAREHLVRITNNIKSSNEAVRSRNTKKNENKPLPFLAEWEEVTDSNEETLREALKAWYASKEAEFAGFGKGNAKEAKQAAGTLWWSFFGEEWTSKQMSLLFVQLMIHCLECPLLSSWMSQRVYIGEAAEFGKEWSLNLDINKAELGSAEMDNIFASLDKQVEDFAGQLTVDVSPEAFLEMAKSGGNRNFFLRALVSLHLSADPKATLAALKRHVDFGGFPEHAEWLEGVLETMVEDHDVVITGVSQGSDDDVMVAGVSRDSDDDKPDESSKRPRISSC